MMRALSLAGAVGLCAGAIAVAVAGFVPAQRAKLLQNLGGGVVVGSLALLGLAFGMV